MNTMITKESLRESLREVQLKNVQVEAFLKKEAESVARERARGDRYERELGDLKAYIQDACIDIQMCATCNKFIHPKKALASDYAEDLIFCSDDCLEEFDSEASQPKEQWTITAGGPRIQNTQSNYLA